MGEAKRRRKKLSSIDEKLRMLGDDPSCVILEAKMICERFGITKQEFRREAESGRITVILAPEEEGRPPRVDADGKAHFGLWLRGDDVIAWLCRREDEPRLH